MHIKKNDNVKVITGKDKGKSGKVLKSLPGKGKVIVAGVNLKKFHQRPRKQGEKGQIIEKNLPIDASNVRLDGPAK